MSDSMTVFDRRIVRLHRDRAAAGFDDHAFLFEEVAERLGERLEDVKRDFPLVLDLGCRDGLLGRVLAGRGGLRSVIGSDLSPRWVARAPGPRLAADEEFLPFAPASFDLVVSNLALHWVNDLPGALLQIRTILKPGGLFLAALFGGETLGELRQSLAEAEMALEGGISPRCSPLISVRDAGALLQRAGFTGPVVDTDLITVSYAEPLRLLLDLRGMGETNAVLERRKTLTRRATLFDALERYQTTFADPEGRVPATFEIVILTAWAEEG